MNNATITQMPTLCVPEKLDRKEAIDHINYLQNSILEQGQTLHDVCCKLHDMNKMALHLESLLGALVDSYDAGDQAAILHQIKQLSERCRSYKKPEVH